jgi:anti-sigma B factor antagonist
MFEIDIRHEPEAQVVAPFGELDIATRDRLQEALSPLLDGACGHVILDLRGVGFMDATAAGLLVSCAERARESDTRFSLMLGAPTSYRVLELFGMLELFEVIGGTDALEPEPSES